MLKIVIDDISNRQRAVRSAVTMRNIDANRNFRIIIGSKSNHPGVILKVDRRLLSRTGFSSDLLLYILLLTVAKEFFRRTVTFSNALHSQP